MAKPAPRERALRSATLVAGILAVSSLVLPASAWAATRATTVAVRNLMPQFWDFWQARFSSSSQADATLYFSDDSTSPLIPARAGYYLGLRVSEYLGRRYSM